MNPVLYPNVSRIPSQPSVDTKKPTGGDAIQKGEFDASLQKAMEPQKSDQAALSKVGQGIKFSTHAMQRLRERNISFDADQMAKLNDAITKADSKGVQDTLVLTDKAALIVNVPNRTVVTAMDKNNLNGNVFTNIDGAVII